MIVRKNIILTLFLLIIIFTVIWLVKFSYKNYSGVLYQPVQVAIAEGDLERLRYLVNEKGFSGDYYTVNTAITYNQLDIFKALLEEFGVPPDSVGLGDRNFLMRAAEANRVHFVDYLLSSGVNPNITDQYGEAPIEYALKYSDTSASDVNTQHSLNQFEIVRLLIEAGADVTSESGENALTYAVLNQNIDIVRLLLSSGVTPVSKNNNDIGPIVHARSEAMIDILMNYGADLEEIDQQGNTVIQFVARSTDSVTLFEHFLKYAPNLCHRDQNGNDIYYYIEMNKGSNMNFVKTDHVDQLAIDTEFYIRDQLIEIINSYKITKNITCQ